MGSVTAAGSNAPRRAALAGSRARVWWWVVRGRWARQAVPPGQPAVAVRAGSCTARTGALPAFDESLRCWMGSCGRLCGR